MGIICNEKCPYVLDYHHIDKGDPVSRSIGYGSIKKVEEEINKCIVVCANCHRKIHYGIIKCPKIISNNKFTIQRLSIEELKKEIIDFKIIQPMFGDELKKGKEYND